MNLDATSEQSVHQCLFDRARVPPVVVANDDALGDTAALEQRCQTMQQEAIDKSELIRSLQEQLSKSSSNNKSDNNHNKNNDRVPSPASVSSLSSYSSSSSTTTCVSAAAPPPPLGGNKKKQRNKKKAAASAVARMNKFVPLAATPSPPRNAWSQKPSLA